MGTHWEQGKFALKGMSRDAGYMKIIERWTTIRLQSIQRLQIDNIPNRNKSENMKNRDPNLEYGNGNLLANKERQGDNVETCEHSENIMGGITRNLTSCLVLVWTLCLMHRCVYLMVHITKWCWVMLVSMTSSFIGFCLVCF